MAPEYVACEFLVSFAYVHADFFDVTFGVPGSPAKEPPPKRRRLAFNTTPPTNTRTPLPTVVAVDGTHAPKPVKNSTCSSCRRALSTKAGHVVSCARYAGRTISHPSPSLIQRP